jgi:pyruvate dehydrogenase E1 component alpha subunit
VPLGTGLAFANHYRGNRSVSMVYFGDGAANQGQVYESFNMAQLWKLPVIYIIENNRYAMGTSVTRSSAQTDFSKRGASFNIPGEKVDGMDVRAVKAAGEHAAELCRAGKGPIILEMQTYRYRGHSMSDPASYRTKEELEKYRLDDPITRLRAQLTREGKLTNEQFDQLDKRAKKVALDSVKFAEESPDPPLEKLYDYTYANGAKP